MKRVVRGALVCSLVLGGVVVGTGSPTVSAQAVFPEFPEGQDKAGACFFDDDSITFIDRLPLIPTPKNRCTSDGGEYVKKAQYKKLQAGSEYGPTAAYNPVLVLTDEQGDALYRRPDECAWLPVTRPGRGWNLIYDVYIARTVELGVGIGYNIIAGDPTGIVVAVMGTILGVAQGVAFELEWRYDLQDECQGALELGTVLDTNARLAPLESDVAGTLGTATATLSKVNATLDATVSSRASQASLDTLATALDAQTTEIDVAIAALSGQLGDTTTVLTAENDENQALIESLTVLTGANQAQAVNFFIEDHLDTCRPLATLLLDGDGLQEETFAFVAGLIADPPIAANLDNAQRDYDRAVAQVSNDPEGAFRHLCTAYSAVSG